MITYCLCCLALLGHIPLVESEKTLVDDPEICFLCLPIWPLGVFRILLSRFLEMIILLRKLQHLDDSSILSDCIGRDGTCVRDYLHIMDLASGHLLALDALGPNSKIFNGDVDASFCRAYNLGRGQGVSVLQIVEAMQKATGFDYKYEIIGRRCVSLYYHLSPPNDHPFY